MKIALASDIHLEFGTLELKNTEGADVLILSGDIMVAEDIRRHPRGSGGEVTKKSTRLASALTYYDFFDQVSSEFPTVLYVAGNHEFYDGYWAKTLSVLKDFADSYSNVHFLERASHTIDDTIFTGSTLWTDFNRGNPITVQSIKNMLNDYRQIANDQREYCRLHPHTVMDRHFLSTAFIRKMIDENPEKKHVVIGHHAPTFESIPVHFRYDTHMNGGYASDLSEFILDHQQIVLWTHGHIHDPCDYMVGDTRILCNPRGYYGQELRAHEFSLKYVEI